MKNKPPNYAGIYIYFVSITWYYMLYIIEYMIVYKRKLF